MRAWPTDETELNRQLEKLMNRNSAWDSVSTEALGIEGIRMCFSCKANKHFECEHHINDGACDAEDFILVGCKCPCEGEVRERGGLIKLVYELRKQGKAERKENQQQVSQIKILNDVIMKVDALVQEFLIGTYDDEGDAENTPQERIDAFMHALEGITEQMNDQMKGLKDK